MEISEIQRVRGTLDLLPDRAARLDSLQSQLLRHFERYGYRPISTPVLENLDLFLRKSGEEIAARMYTFTHWNRRLCLRPEFTASVMRAYVNHLQDQPLPTRLYYAGPTFRYEKPQRGRYRQFTEVGLECVGGPAPEADAEVLATACGALERIGLTGHRIVVGHLGAVLESLQQLGLEEHAQSVILGHMEMLIHRSADRVAIRERMLDLLGAPSADEEAASSSTFLDELGAGDATRMTIDLLERASLGLEGSSRTPEEIVQRLLRKGERRKLIGQVDRAMECVLALHRAAGPLETALPETRVIFKEHGLHLTPLDEVQRVLEVFDAYGYSGHNIVVDLSLARGLRYYTGLVFEMYHDGPRGPVQLCGGGRYDGLVKALGGRAQIPACGFSFGLERVDLALEQEQGDPPIADVESILVAPIESDDTADAIRIAQGLRDEGHAVELDLRYRGVRGNLRHADRSGVRHVVLIGARERADDMVLLRDMQLREERLVPRAELNRALAAAEQPVS
ncbi:MAG TPA: histidine--tRNA ligase [Chloroflexota bacterium]|nr:histidine--tRNA ligase [Chloroflexota bacterium]